MSTTTMSLGEILKKNQLIHDEAVRKAEQEKAEAVARKKSKDTEVIRNFYENAKEYFTTQIQAGKLTKDMHILIGCKSSGASQNSSFKEISGISNHSMTGVGIEAIVEKQPEYGALWLEFKQWCNDSGLTPFFQDEWDNTSCWYMLKVKFLG